MAEVMIEKPVISKKLAEMYENKKTEDDFLTLTTPILYINTQDYVDENQMGILLSRMYILGYEIEKTKKYLIKSPLVDDEGDSQYIMRDHVDDNDEIRYWFAFDCEDDVDAYFTKAEIDADEGLKKLASVCELIEVEN